MAESKGQPEGEHIEELLSQLKGIFGHLSETEQEEAKQKVSPPPIPERPAAPAFPPASAAPTDPVFETPIEPVAEPMLETDFSTSIPDPFASALPDPIEVVPVSPSEPPGQPAATTPEPAAAEIVVPPGATLVQSTIFYPPGRINEAKVLADKVSKITPRFTKVQVVIMVQAMASYDPKSDLKSTILPQVESQPAKAVFLLTEKPIDDPRRKAVLAELEPKGIYFQEVLVQQIEKKAIYTDMLLGMVFFFDSQKPAGGAD
jgi:hypothetical protein